MNGKWYIVLTILFSWMFPFTFHDDLIPMTFNGETLDIISGLLTGGLYHLNTRTCPNRGNLDGNTDDVGNDTYNVSDIVILANCILVSNCDGLEFTCAADVNGDTNYNVLDIVQLANCVLAQNCG